MLAEPHFNVLRSSHSPFVCTYYTQPIDLRVVDQPLVRFDETGALDAVVVTNEIYEMLSFAPSQSPVRLEQVFALLQMSGVQWQLVKPFAPPNIIAQRAQALMREHAAIGRKHWRGGRRTFVDQVIFWCKRYLWHPLQWGMFCQALVFERRWMMYQNERAFMWQLALILRRAK